MMERLADEALMNAHDVFRAQQLDGTVREIGVEEMRRRYREGGGGFAAPAKLDVAEEIEVGNGQILRIFRPDAPDGIYLMFHSGGWMSGGADLQDERMASLAERANVVVVCASYRLSPEVRHPAALDDCEAAARWVLNHGAGEFGTDRVVIGGESAGAHLAALTLLRLRETGDLGQVVGANLIYGLFDLSLSPSARLAGDDGIVLTTDTLRYMVDLYLAEGTDATDPTVSPVFSPLHDLPPARFVVGDLDPLIDDSLTLSMRWRAAGNQAVTEIYPNCVHAFDAMPIAMADLCRENQAEWIATVLRGGLR